ncbi:lipase family protein [Aliikangiella marina]|uniref:Lipase family protein n=1 Tax=Aliikangiella marina TaxID=1712262 RepID=A0A545TJ34_9GAMM|nr:lipase family protein [Aliikangiella marina]TQV77240.1 lipase family protein [Aliikangiella marina]
MAYVSLNKLDIQTKETVIGAANELLSASDKLFDKEPFFSNFDGNAQLATLPNQFHHANAICLVRAAVIAYKGEKLQQYETERSPEQADYHFYENQKTNSQAFTALYPNDLIVSFRGTQTDDFRDQIGDMLTNIQVSKDSFENGKQTIAHYKVHSGFQKALLSLWDDEGLGNYIVDCLQKHSTIKVWFTGHSLGGALATIASARLLNLGDGEHFYSNRIGGLYTIGQPRVGDANFAEALSKELGENRITRMVNNNDIVTMIPFWKFSHIHGRRYISSNGELKHKFTNSDIRNDRIKGILIFIFWYGIKYALNRFIGLKIKSKSIIADHDKYGYLAAIRKSLNK